MVKDKRENTFLPFSDRRALVVGGTGGIGREVALGLSRRGAEVTVHGGSSRQRLDDTIAALRAIGGKGDGFLFPVNSPEAASDIFARFASTGLQAGRASPLDILVCAWGPFKQGRLEFLDREIWQKTAENNLVFPGVLVSLVISGMIERNWGRILLFGGTNTDTIRGFITTTAYSAAKTALGVLAKSVAKTAGCRGVTCNVVCPGLTDTEYTAEDQQYYNREKSPGKNPLNAGQVAKVALAILENPACNGAIVPVDQGIAL